MFFVGKSVSRTKHNNEVTHSRTAPQASLDNSNPYKSKYLLGVNDRSYQLKY